MATDNDSIKSEVDNEENDAREEDIVRDEDADTEDVENSQHDYFEQNEQRFAGIEATLGKILGELSSLREAQGILVENGAVVNDTNTDIGHIEEDEFVPPREMDLLI